MSSCEKAPSFEKLPQAELSVKAALRLKGWQAEATSAQPASEAFHPQPGTPESESFLQHDPSMACRVRSG